ncbi:MAG TPA: TolC family protein [Gemmatimonadaceae bacterium]|nr:TolC family protein [Gemmatimonadaceae bacterium]
MHRTMFTALAALAICATGGLSVVTPTTALAQQGDSTSVDAVLSLQEAINIALQNNPQHLQTLQARNVASAAKRAAYGDFLPQVNARLGGSFTKQGVTPVAAGVNLGTVGSDVLTSNYGIDVSMSVNGTTLINPRVQAASLDAAEADINGSQALVRSTVTQAYMTVLQSQAQAALEDTLVASAETQLELARARLSVGAGTQLDVSQAEVQLGRAQVTALQAHNQVEIDKLRLFQQMGVTPPAHVQLTTEFQVTPPTFTLESVLGTAEQRNPALEAVVARERVANLQVKQQKTSYLPTLSISTGWSGFAQELTNSDFAVQQGMLQAQASRASCFLNDSIRSGAGLSPIGGCDAIVFTPADAAQIRAQNNQFPFGFNKNPFQISASLSLPIFDGFSREQRLEQAQANAADARYRVRAQRLQLQADVTAAYLTLQTDARSVELEEKNAATAREALRLQEERYRVGAANSVELAQARADYETAERARINAIYEYHKAFAALESAVGRPLR